MLGVDDSSHCLPDSDRRQRSIVALSWAVIAVANCTMLFLIAHSPAHSIYDETWFIDTLDMLRRDGLFSRAFLLEYPGTPGPTFTAIYTGLQDLLHLSYPWLRLVNFAFLLGTAVLLWLLLRAIPAFSLGRRSGIDAALLAGTFTVLPAIGASGGMTLTEMPAMFIMLIFLVGLSVVLTWERRAVPALALSLLCGAVLAAAIMGRQNYLLVLPCLLLLVPVPGGVVDRATLACIAAIGAVTLCLVSPIFLIWGGLVPPKAAYVGAGYSVWNGIASVGYAGLVAAVLSPRLYRILFVRWRYSIAILACVAALAATFGAVRVPARSVLASIANATTLSMIGHGFAVVLAVVCVSFLYCMAHYLWKHRADRIVRFAGCVFALGILSNAKISVQFSSRYVVIFIPFLLLALAPTIRMNWHLPPRLAIGACISLASLYSYYAMG